MERMRIKIESLPLTMRGTLRGFQTTCGIGREPLWVLQIPCWWNNSPSDEQQPTTEVNHDTDTTQGDSIPMLIAVLYSHPWNKLAYSWQIK
jgi:hypothetical protein